jgi:sigma-E factor negative regulatory protein RseA
MTEKSDEHLSAFFDGELDERDIERVMTQLGQDEKLTSSWDRYQLIGDAIRGQLPQQVSTDLAARVSDLVRDEPAILAPRRATVHKLVRPAVGVALAASVAGVALLFFPAANQEPGVLKDQLVQVSPQPSRVASRGIRWSTGEPAVASKLNRYLVNHNELARSGSIKGMLPYARLVGYEQGR